MTGKIMLVRFIRTAMGTYFIALRHKYRRRRKEGFKHARWPRLALDSSMLLKLQANNLHHRQEIIFHYTHTHTNTSTCQKMDGLLEYYGGRRGAISRNASHQIFKFNFPLGKRASAVEKASAPRALCQTHGLTHRRR